jgi:hypothetical protein
LNLKRTKQLSNLYFMKKVLPISVMLISITAISILGISSTAWAAAIPIHSNGATTMQFNGCEAEKNECSIDYYLRPAQGVRTIGKVG